MCVCVNMSSVCGGREGIRSPRTNIAGSWFYQMGAENQESSARQPVLVLLLN